MPVAGERAPGFALPLAGGGLLRFPGGRPAPILLAFFKDDCPTCRFTFPFLQRLHEHAGEALRVAGVSQDDAARAGAWAAELGLTFPVAVDASGLVVGVEVGFRRDALQALAGNLAGLAGVPEPALYRAGEDVPPLKPG